MRNELNRWMIICIPLSLPDDDAQEGFLLSAQHIPFSSRSPTPRLKLINIARAFKYEVVASKRVSSEAIHIDVRHGNILNYFYSFAWSFLILNFAKVFLE